jgi:hypothetical protein
MNLLKEFDNHPISKGQYWLSVFLSQNDAPEYRSMCTT